MRMKKITIGIVAHVDAGKTTLTESILYLSGNIKKQGRVDNGDAFLDYNKQEKDRGITIFSKQAIIDWNDTRFTLVDTPGHIDFSTEMERVLQILDYALVVVNANDGVQAHTETIWNLLRHYQIPTFIFINKMDISHISRNQLMNAIKKRLDERCIDFSNETTHNEEIALCNEELLDYFITYNSFTTPMITQAISQRNLFPCFFGSALKNKGIIEVLNGLSLYTKQQAYPSAFGAKVFKVTRDEQGNKLTHMKITGGRLKVKQKITDQEKVDQIRQYSGDKYQTFEEVFAGDICAIKGLKNIVAGTALGIDTNFLQPQLSSYMKYRVVLPEGEDHYKMFINLQQLEEEDPSLRIQYHQQLQEINIQLMGDIQTEVLKKIIKQRFYVDVTFDQGTIAYKETILEPVEGIGHYEPLRHYAEVHLLLEPSQRGSGLCFSSECSEDIVSRAYQRLILTHLAEKEHLGVLTGSPITDMKITLLIGKAHLEHTVGGDFREATYRAVRHGLKSAKSVILEPYYQFRLEVPSDCLSKAIYDIELMNGSYTMLETTNQTTILLGKAPVRKMQHYQKEVATYTQGLGRFTCHVVGYEISKDQEEIKTLINYDSENDIDNPTGSIFCKQGAGFNVSWHQVKDYMHLDFQYHPNRTQERTIETYSSNLMKDEELEEIFKRTYGDVKVRLFDDYHHQTTEKVPVMLAKSLPECLLVDGYNVIHAWPELRSIANDNLDAARTRLIQILSNYQGYKNCILIIVFDAYKVKQNIGSLEQNHNIYIVYTKESQTADMYIERATHELASKYSVIVATSDALEQSIVIGKGARRMSSRELQLEVDAYTKEKFEEFERKKPKSKVVLEDVANFQNKK